MSMDIQKCIALFKKHPELDGFPSSWGDPKHPLKAYRLLKERRAVLEEPLYAYCLRKLLEMSTADVPQELRLQMLRGVSKEDLMYQEELDALRRLEFPVTIYRGAPYSEQCPGLSWSLDRRVAEGFYRGKLFQAKASEASIIAYFDSQNESEILASITNFKIMEEDATFSQSYQDKIEADLEEMRKAGLIGNAS